MNTNNFIELLKDPTKISAENSSKIASIIDEYPYFQAARAIYLKGLKNENSFKYNSELKKTAAYTTDRTILFDFITSKKFIDSPKTTTSLVSKIQQVATSIISQKESSKEDASKKITIGSPIPFNNEDTYSFNEWLQIASHKKIERKENNASEKEIIIDNFIKNNPKIIPVDKNSSSTIKIQEATSDKHLMTETLAKVYLEQKKYDSAIKAYEILSLKYPEKSSFFADHVKKIRILQKNKS